MSRRTSNRSAGAGRESHEAAVSRRLELLSAEWEAMRTAPTRPGRPGSREEFEGGEATPPTHTRIAERRVPRPEPSIEPADDPPEEWEAEQALPEPDPEPIGDPVVAQVPEPGRHARRRRTPGFSADGWLPTTLRGRTFIGPAQVAVVAVLVAVGLATTAWWVLRGESSELPVSDAAPTNLATAASMPAQPGGSAPVTPAGGETDPAGGDTVVVDVAGKVRKPGLVELPVGSRVADALEAAGGARDRVRLGSLNLARPLVDGEQILVGEQPPPGVANAPVPTGAPSGTVMVNLNTADATTLETLPEVGPVTAEAIIAWRTEHGSFTSVEELLEIDGIGEATLAQIAPHVTV